MWFPWSSVCLFHCFKTLHIILCNQFCVLHKLLLLFHFVMYGLTLSLNCCSMVGDIMTTQMMVTNRKYKAYMTRVPVDCLILGQQLQQHEQAAEPQQQASCRQRTMGNRYHISFTFFHSYKASVSYSVFPLPLYQGGGPKKDLHIYQKYVKLHIALVAEVQTFHRHVIQE